MILRHFQKKNSGLEKEGDPTDRRFLSALSGPVVKLLIPVIKPVVKSLIPKIAGSVLGPQARDH